MELSVSEKEKPRNAHHMDKITQFNHPKIQERSKLQYKYSISQMSGMVENKSENVFLPKL